MGRVAMLAVSPDLLACVPSGGITFARHGVDKCFTQRVGYSGVNTP
jgi:hypothetical protein